MIRFFLLLYLFTATVQAVEVEVRDDLKLPVNTPEKILAAAKAKHAGVPLRIEFYKVASRDDLCFGLARFEREIKGTEAHDFYYHCTVRLKDGVITREEIFNNTWWIFPLKAAPLFLRPQPETSYDSILSLLRALEANKVQVNYMPTITQDGNRMTHIPSPVQAALPRAEDLFQVVHLRRDPKSGEISMILSSGKGSGISFDFKKEADGFRCVRSGSVWF